MLPWQRQKRPEILFFDVNNLKALLCKVLFFIPLTSIKINKAHVSTNFKNNLYMKHSKRKQRILKT